MRGKNACRYQKTFITVPKNFCRKNLRKEVDTDSCELFTSIKRLLSPPSYDLHADHEQIWPQYLAIPCLNHTAWQIFQPMVWNTNLITIRRRFFTRSFGDSHGSPTLLYQYHLELLKYLTKGSHSAWPAGGSKQSTIFQPNFVLQKWSAMETR